MLFPDGRRIANHETVESDPDVLELKPLTVSPRMGATDGATDDPRSLISGFRLVVASNVVPVKVWHKPATAEHFRIPPMTVPSAAFCPIYDLLLHVPSGLSAGKVTFMLSKSCTILCMS